MVVNVFVKDGKCVQCDWTIKKLVDRNIQYKVFVLKDDLLADFKSKGFMAAPIVQAGDIEWSGFRPDMIDKI